MKQPAFFGIGGIALVLLLSAHSVQGTELCKWVDENGTVHYAEVCPDSVEGAAVGVDDNESVAAADDPYAASREKMDARHSAVQPEPATTVALPDYSGMSASQLARECETQREQLLAPEREQLIKKCTEDGEGSAAHCQRYYADWGDGGARGGHHIARRYDDLPVCIAAREKGN